jgi:hypothetical protein
MSSSLPRMPIRHVSVRRNSRRNERFRGATRPLGMEILDRRDFPCGIAVSEGFEGSFPGRHRSAGAANNSGMPAYGDGVNSSSGGERIYSVPRRYDLATLFAVTLAYALLFGALRAKHAEPGMMCAAGAFVTCVGLGQALLFKGLAPRRASILVGSILLGTVPLIVSLTSGYRDVEWVAVVCMETFLLLCGGCLGYVAGVLIGGVFLLVDHIQKTGDHDSFTEKELLSSVNAH